MKIKKLILIALAVIGITSSASAEQKETAAKAGTSIFSPDPGSGQSGDTCAG